MITVNAWNDTPLPSHMLIDMPSTDTYFIDMFSSLLNVIFTDIAVTSAMTYTFF